MLNRVILIGRLTADPEVRYTQSGIAVANFRLAVDRRFKDAQGERQTDFINIVTWRKTAELVGQYVKKGYLIGLEGFLQMRQYQNKEGENRTVYEVVADSVQFLDRGSGGGGSGARESTAAPSDSDAPPEYSSQEPPSDNELPF